MFTKEIKVKGEIVKGQIIGNWSKKSYYALKLTELNPQTLDDEDLDKLINELIAIKEQVYILNEEYERSKIK
ncbi:hypothetical protein JK635_02205 [Neobacillus sp. YIM B02564]|uniref:Uncharacterized protein n=1 Tax=Neobacillus paridis TaxID=2803862 RepID=A0ABS1TIB7_9BACI|nr:hypothetical protein [Neobacillus paridis]MBL4951052.1 hypothetical protein [Neobacillus paridis]